LWVVAGLAGLVLLLVVAVPAVKLLRRARRRRLPPRQAVIGAWLDVRDALRDQGVAVPAGSTARDLMGVAPVDPADLHELAICLDAALWTGYDAEPGLVGRAWAAAGGVRRVLRRGPVRGRLRAAFAVRTLRRERAQAGWQPAPRSA
jgi:hypothetical protein